MNKKIVIAAGGTGGHLFPAESLALSLRETIPNLDICFMGKGLSTTPRFSRSFPFQDISAANLSKNPMKLVVNSLKMAYGTANSLRFLRAFRPDLVVGFGSYHVVPTLLAASLLQLPIILHECNAIPGKVNRLFSRKAMWTGLFFNQAKEKLAGMTRQVDIPMRKEMKNPLLRPNRIEALNYYGLEPNRKTILVFGGSQGALGVNKLFTEALTFMDCQQLQVLHCTGSVDDMARWYQNRGILSHVTAFEPKMHYAYAAADCVIARSGASSIAETMMYELPTIFIPYPHAADNHQYHNARFVVETIGAGVLHEESTLHPELLANEINTILHDNTLAMMKSRLNRYNRETKIDDFCDLIGQFLS